MATEEALIGETSLGDLSDPAGATPLPTARSEATTRTNAAQHDMVVEAVHSSAQSDWVEVTFNQNE